MTARRRFSPNHRHLLLFAPSADDDRLARIERDLREHATAVSHRDLVVHRAAPTDPASLRDAWDVPADAFCLILVGKDGGEKLRRDEPVELSEIFALIDSMPMRRHPKAAASAIVSRIGVSWSM